MRIDLHTHSSVSDGTDPPAVLVRRAAEVGLDIVALTDHDTYDGWPDALEAGRGAGVEVVPGVEISTRLAGTGVHLLAYFVDPGFQPLAAELAQVRADRRARLRRIAGRLTEAGMPLTEDEILAQAAVASTVGRPHVADAMIAKGYVRHRGEAFARWLSEGRAGYIPKYAPDTFRAVELVRAAGGVAVVAHPWGRGSREALDPATVAELAANGLDGIEVDHEDHDSDTRRELADLADSLGLVATGSSDYHGTGKVGHDLGLNTTAPEQWERLSGLARERRDPGVRQA